MLFVAQTVVAVAESLESAGVRGLVAVLEQPRIARALAARGYRVLLTSTRVRALRKHPGPAVYARAGALPLIDGAAAVIGFGAGAAGDWPALLAEWTRVAGDGGAVVLVDKGDAEELSRRALCGGLAEIQQRTAGRTLVTSGLSTRL